MKGKQKFGSSSSSNVSALRRAAMERRFREKLHNLGLEMHETEPDGNCLFRSFAHQMYGDQSFHNLVREACMNYMEKERDYYSQYISEDFEQYIRRKRRDRVFGNHVEIQAMAELYARPVEVYAVEDFIKSEDARPWCITQEGYEGTPVRLSYHDGNHYNTIINPSDPRIGEGLLPGFKSREEIENDLVRRVTDMTDRDSVQQDLETMVIEQSALEDEEILMKRIQAKTLAEEEDRILKEFQKKQYAEMVEESRMRQGGNNDRNSTNNESLSRGRVTTYTLEGDRVQTEEDVLAQVLAMTAEEEERKLLERAKWESLRKQ